MTSWPIRISICTDQHSPIGRNQNPADRFWQSNRAGYLTFEYLSKVSNSTDYWFIVGLDRARHNRIIRCNFIHWVRSKTGRSVTLVYREATESHVVFTSILLFLLTRRSFLQEYIYSILHQWIKKKNWKNGNWEKECLNQWCGSGSGSGRIRIYLGLWIRTGSGSRGI